MEACSHIEIIMQSHFKYALVMKDIVFSLSHWEMGFA